MDVFILFFKCLGLSFQIYAAVQKVCLSHLSLQNEVQNRHMICRFGAHKWKQLILDHLFVHVNNTAVWVVRKKHDVLWQTEVMSCHALDITKSAGFWSKTHLKTVARVLDKEKRPHFSVIDHSKSKKSLHLEFLDTYG